MRRKNSKGFTLVEIMVVLAILGIVVVGVLGLVTRQNKAYHSEESIIDMQMNARVAMDRIVHLIRMTGFGCKDSFGTNLTSGNLATEGDVAPDPTTNLMVAASNQLTIVSAFRYIGKITAIPAANKITLDTISSTLNSAEAEKSYISIFPSPTQRFETLNDITGNTITTNNNLHAQVNDLVYQVQAHTIHLVGGNLRLDENINPSNTQLEVAENIENLQFQYGVDTTGNGYVDAWNNPPVNISQIKAVKIFLLARTANPDRKEDYTDKKTYTLAGVTIGPFNDHFHRYLIETTVFIRNLNL